MQDSTGRKGARFLFVSNTTPPTSRHDGERTTAIQVAWRVIAANNHPLGRSGAIFGSYAAAVGDAVQVKLDVEQGQFTSSTEGTLGQWTWQLVTAGRVAAESIRDYKRPGECSRSLEQFRAAVCSADPTSAGLRELGPGALRVYRSRSSSAPPRLQLRSSNR